MSERYYSFLARAYFRDPAKQLEIYTEGINNVSSLTMCFGLIKDRALLNKQLGNEKEYLEDRKTLLLLKKMEQLGMIKFIKQ